jgi:hypothetical protein
MNREEYPDDEHDADHMNFEEEDDDSGDDDDEDEEEHEADHDDNDDPQQQQEGNNNRPNLPLNNEFMPQEDNELMELGILDGGDVADDLPEAQQQHRRLETNRNNASMVRLMFDIWIVFSFFYIITSLILHFLILIEYLILLIPADIIDRHSSLNVWILSQPP